jgi:hypothetical protein
MNLHHTTIRDLTCNPALEAFELQDVNARDLNVQDADAFPDDRMNDAEIDALYEAEMERRDRDSREVFCGTGDDDNDPDRTPPAGGLRFPGFRQMPDDELIAVVADPMLMPGEPEEELLREATAELLARLDARRRHAA